ncbi:ileal sodium/bile acid cotransporter-like [Amblyomma americanum]
MHVHRFSAAILCILSWTVLLDLASSLHATDESLFINTAAAPNKQAIEFRKDGLANRGGVYGGDVSDNDTIMFFMPPQRIDVEEDRDVVVKVTFATPANRTITVTSADTEVATVDVFKVYLNAETNGTGFNVTVHGVFVSYTKLFFKVCLLEGDSETNCTEHDYLIAVLRVPMAFQKAFPILIGVIVFFNYVSMGCQIDLGLIWNTLKKPLPPLLGCSCKFLFMPLVAYGVGLLLLEDPLMRFGMFMLTCSPSGTTSNLWTLLFNGDVTLSVTMTFIGTIASLGLMPLWMFILGRHMSPETGVLNIPFGNMVASLVGLAVPLGIGMATQRFKPNWALALKKYIKPITMIVLIAILVLSVTVNKYIFLLMTWQSLVCGAVIPWSAYVFGPLAAFVARLTRPQFIAVVLEIALQNSGIAVVIVYTSLPLPDADLVIVPVVCQALLQGLPLYVLYTVMRIKKCISKRLHPKEEVPSESSS